MIIGRWKCRSRSTFTKIAVSQLLYEWFLPNFYRNEGREQCHKYEFNYFLLSYLVCRHWQLISYWVDAPTFFPRLARPSPWSCSCSQRLRGSVCYRMASLQQTTCVNYTACTWYLCLSLPPGSTRLKFANRSPRNASPRLWNSLPINLRSFAPDTLHSTTVISSTPSHPFKALCLSLAISFFRALKPTSSLSPTLHNFCAFPSFPASSRPAYFNQSWLRINATKHLRIHHHLRVLVSRELYKALLYFTLLYFTLLYWYTILICFKRIYSIEFRLVNCLFNTSLCDEVHGE